MNDNKLQEYSKKARFPDDRRLLKKVIDVNNGKVSAVLLRANFPFGYNGCAVVALDLGSLGLVKLVDKIENMQILLYEERDGFI